MRHAPFRLSRELLQPVQPVRWGAGEKDLGSSYSSLRSSLCSRSRSLKQPRDAMLSKTSGSSSPLEGRLRMATLRPGAGSRQGSGSCFPPLEWCRNTLEKTAYVIEPLLFKAYVKCPDYSSQDLESGFPALLPQTQGVQTLVLPSLVSTSSLSLALSASVHIRKFETVVPSIHPAHQEHGIPPSTFLF